jgi:hypothetical protein
MQKKVMSMARGGNKSKSGVNKELLYYEAAAKMGQWSQLVLA